MRDLDSLVDQALQEEYEKAQREGAVPWNDAGPAVTPNWQCPVCVRWVTTTEAEHLATCQRH
jgi:hypothetical protein